MVSINGLPPSIASSTRKTSKASKRAQDTRALDSSSTVLPTKVANAVAQSIRSVEEPDIQYSNLQYDFPPGESQKAMSYYLDIFNQSKREELARLIGVDIYI